MPEPSTPGQVAYAAYVACMDEAQRCGCDTDNTPLCVRCECLLVLACAAVEWAMPGRRGARRPRYA